MRSTCHVKHVLNSVQKVRMESGRDIGDKESRILFRKFFPNAIELNPGDSYRWCTTDDVRRMIPIQQITKLDLHCPSSRFF